MRRHKFLATASMQRWARRSALFACFAAFLCLASLFLVDIASAQDGLDGIRKRLVQPAVLRGEFTQQKRLTGFRNPLRSSGAFLLAKEHGIVWRTLVPFPSTMVVTSDRILSRLADGSTRIELDAQEQPALGAVNALLFALFAGDVEVLSERFETAAAMPDSSHWTLGLVPKPGAFGAVFLRIDVEGDAFVRHVRIEERGGDVTEISFTALIDAPAALTDDEARQFD